MSSIRCGTASRKENGWCGVCVCVCMGGGGGGIIGTIQLASIIAIAARKWI